MDYREDKDNSNLSITPRGRVLASATGVIPAVVGIPILMSSWAPTWAVTAWVLAYMAITISAWGLILSGSDNVEHWWSAVAGAAIGVLPLSAHYFDQGGRSVWIAGAVCLLAVAIEVSSLPFLPIYEWRIGPIVSAAMFTVATFLDVGPPALLVIPVFIQIFRGADHMRQTKTTLEVSISRANTLARNDELTKLLNRRGLASELARLHAEGPYTLIMFDADRFKAINDSHGHGVGDQVLVELARAIRARLPEPWILGRQGGDEFVAIAPGFHDIPASVGDPVRCNISLYGTDSHIVTKISGGIVRSRDDVDIDRLLSMAGYAMRRAKHGGGGLEPFGDDLAEQFDRMLEVSGAEGKGFDADSFYADFQTIVDSEGRTVGCEALCRWRRPDGTVLAPDLFLPILAEGGRMPMLNEIMLRKGVEFAARFSDLEKRPFVAINITSSSLGRGRFVPFLQQLLKEHNVGPAQIMIELTESEFLNSDAPWHQEAVDLLELGVKLAIDDFGAGYSNIERLSVLPISHLKFDRSLTSSANNPIGQVVRGVVRFSAATNIGIIAEGVETEREAASMAELGVGLFQGFHFSMPRSADLVEAQIRREHDGGVESSRIVPIAS